MNNEFKNLCATFKHLDVLETGREFDRIVDTEFTHFNCKMLGWKKKEFYLMAPVEKELKTDVRICEFWEEWNPEESVSKASTQE